MNARPLHLTTSSRAAARSSGKGGNPNVLHSCTLAAICVARASLRSRRDQHCCSRIRSVPLPTGRRSVKPTFTKSAASEDRTHDLRIMRPTRCQLRYRRMCWDALSSQPQASLALQALSSQRAAKPSTIARDSTMVQGSGPKAVLDFLAWEGAYQIYDRARAPALGLRPMLGHDIVLKYSICVACASLPRAWARAWAWAWAKAWAWAWALAWAWGWAWGWAWAWPFAWARVYITMPASIVYFRSIAWAQGPGPRLSYRGLVIYLRAAQGPGLGMPHPVGLGLPPEARGYIIEACLMVSLPPRPRPRPMARDMLLLPDKATPILLRREKMEKWWKT